MQPTVPCSVHVVLYSRRGLFAAVPADPAHALNPARPRSTPPTYLRPFNLTRARPPHWPPASPASRACAHQNTLAGVSALSPDFFPLYTTPFQPTTLRPSSHRTLCSITHFLFHHVTAQVMASADYHSRGQHRCLLVALEVEQQDEIDAFRYNDTGQFYSWARCGGNNKENWPVVVRARRRRRSQAGRRWCPRRRPKKMARFETRGATAAEIAAWNQAEFAAMRLHPSYSCVQGTSTVMCVCV